MRAIELVIAAVLVALVAAIVWAAVGASNRPDLILKKDDWTCTRHSTRLTPAGKVLIPITRCDEYRRVG